MRTIKSWSDGYIRQTAKKAKSLNRRLPISSRNGKKKGERISRQIQHSLFAQFIPKQALNGPLKDQVNELEQPLHCSQFQVKA